MHVRQALSFVHNAWVGGTEGFGTQSELVEGYPIQLAYGAKLTDMNIYFIIINI